MNESKVLSMLAALRLEIRAATLSATLSAAISSGTSGETVTTVGATVRELQAQADVLSAAAMKE